MSDEEKIEAALLRAARSYTRPPESRERVMMALGVSGRLAPGAGKIGWLKIAGLVGTTGVIGAIVIAQTLHTKPSAVPPSVTPTALAIPSESTPITIPAPPIEQTAPVLTAPTASSPPPKPSRPTTQVAPASSSLAEEVKMLDRASASLANHDGAGALSELDAYQARFPHGSMNLEATVLRIEALRQTGNASAADALADDFLAKHPTSPLAQRVRADKKGP